ncbi:hypothetical protein T484DRAFT_1778388 [Baffinella frigidus]|nr:hypothetical protein T484DRAFT_1778388 [Cryptophyta sp. CCMP2293]
MRRACAAGADPAGLAGSKIRGGRGETPEAIARQSGADAVLAVLLEFPARLATPATVVRAVEVVAAGYAPVVGRYEARDQAEIPVGFSAVCRDNGWPPAATWHKLNGGEHSRWFAHTDAENHSYVYYNAGDSCWWIDGLGAYKAPAGDACWWIDGPDGLGAYKAPGVPWAPPGGSTAWQSLRASDPAGERAPPTLAVFRGESCEPL